MKSKSLALHCAGLFVSRVLEMKKIIKPIDRFKQFLKFCEDLNNHPFVIKHKKGYTFQYTEKINYFDNSESTYESNFDEIHLESLLTRIRQFIFEGELFYYRDLFKDIEELFGHNSEIKKFYESMDKNLTGPLEVGNIRIIKVENGIGRILIQGKTLKELIEARLYGGAIHSERLLSPEPGSLISDFNREDKKMYQHLNWELSGAAILTVGNIWKFRNQIVFLARQINKINICDELNDFNERAKLNGM